MSESTAESQNEQQNDGGSTSGYTPPATQADFERIISDRVMRERAKYADHAGLKAKAAQFDALEAANLTESEKTANRLSAADAEVAKVPAKVAEALRDSLIALGVIPEARKVLLTASDPETLLAQVKAIQEIDADRRTHGNHVPREGTTTTTVEGEAAETVRELFAG